MQSIVNLYHSFAATPAGHDAITGFLVLFVADLVMWLKDTSGWKIPGYQWKTALKRYVSGFGLGYLKGLGLG